MDPTPITCADIAIVSCIDTNKSIIDENGDLIKAFYELEAVRLAKSLRENGGWMKDINVYFICPRGDIISNGTIQKLRQLGCTYIPIAGDNAYLARYMFYDQFLVQQLSEKLDAIKESILVQLDLDMEILKPFPEDWFQKARCQKTSLAYHDHPEGHAFSKSFLHRLENVQKLGGKCFNSYIQIWDKRIKFFQRVEEISKSEAYKKFYAENIKSNQTDYYFEEAVYDYIYAFKQIPEDQLNLLKISQIENTYFSHGHLDYREAMKAKTKAS